MAEETLALGEILARLEKVERENRTSKRVGSVGILLVAMLIVMGQAKPNRNIVAESIKAATIEAQGIYLEDEQGRHLARLQPWLDGASLNLGKGDSQVEIATAYA